MAKKNTVSVFINLTLASDVATGKLDPRTQVGCGRRMDGKLGNAYVAFNDDGSPVITQTGHKFNVRFPED